MRPRLAALSGVLHLVRRARGVQLETYDWDGRPLAEGFPLADTAAGAADPRGLALDGDRRLWIADRRACALRAFSVFGVEVARIQAPPASRAESPGALVELSALAAAGVEEELVLVAASGGERRHALQLFAADGSLRASLRPLGDPQARFRGLADVCLLGRLLYACEEEAGRIQVFRDGEFHFAARVGAGLRPRCLAPLADGRLVAAQAGDASALVLLEADGRVAARIAAHGTRDGEVCDPSSIAVEEGPDERHTRVAVLDQGGDRVQVFALDGRCFGSFPDLPCATF